MNNLASRTGQTRARLIKAATEVFAKAGLSGATTREIAHVAGVNEVTLFRHFQSKEQLVPQGGIQNSKFKIQNEYSVRFSEILHGMSIYAVQY